MYRPPIGSVPGRLWRSGTLYADITTQWQNKALRINLDHLSHSLTAVPRNKSLIALKSLSNQCLSIPVDRDELRPIPIDRMTLLFPNIYFIFAEYNTGA